MSELSIEQVERMEAAVQALAGNSFARAVTTALEGKTPEEKRKVVAVAYAQMYETMLAFQMAKDSKKSPADVKAALVPQQDWSPKVETREAA